MKQYIIPYCHIFIHDYIIIHIYKISVYPVLNTTSLRERCSKDIAKFLKETPTNEIFEFKLVESTPLKKESITTSFFITLLYQLF